MCGKTTGGCVAYMFGCVVIEREYGRIMKSVD